jgi:fructokinase
VELGSDPSADILVAVMEKRGMSTRYVKRTPGLPTPSIIQNVDTAKRTHSFAFVDPVTGNKLQRYLPPTEADIEEVLPSVRTCGVLFVDRLTDVSLNAMRTAHRSGTTVVFEPQEIGEPLRFAEALRHSHVLKCSRERLEGIVATKGVRPDLIIVVTAGEFGLDIYRHFRRVGLPAVKADLVIDTCGSGDMTTVGLIDGILANGRSPQSIEDVVPGLVAGQRLAAAGCGYVGALGLVRHLDADEIRRVMRDGTTRLSPVIVPGADDFEDQSVDVEEILEAEAEGIRRFLDKPGTRPSRMQLARAREVMMAVGRRVASSPGIEKSVEEGGMDRKFVDRAADHIGA